jgi:hypothetical protein
MLLMIADFLVFFYYYNFSVVVSAISIFTKDDVSASINCCLLLFLIPSFTSVVINFVVRPIKER